MQRFEHNFILVLVLFEKDAEKDQIYDSLISTIEQEKRAEKI
jgi:hypothetical protein